MYLFPFRLRSILKQLEENDVDFEEIKKNLEFTASLLEAVYLDGTRCVALFKLFKWTFYKKNDCVYLNVFLRGMATRSVK